MPAAAAVPAPAVPVERHQSFLSILPAIRVHARAGFAHLRSAHDWEDAEAEVIARSWETFLAAPHRPP